MHLRILLNRAPLPVILPCACTFAISESWPQNILTVALIIYFKLFDKICGIPLFLRTWVTSRKQIGHSTVRSMLSLQSRFSFHIGAIRISLQSLPIWNKMREHTLFDEPIDKVSLGPISMVLIFWYGKRRKKIAHLN